jgi:hypothetical protein
VKPIKRISTTNIKAGSVKKKEASPRPSSDDSGALLKRIAVENADRGLFDNLETRKD